MSSRPRWPKSRPGQWSVQTRRRLGRSLMLELQGVLRPFNRSSGRHRSRMTRSASPIMQASASHSRSRSAPTCHRIRTNRARCRSDGATGGRGSGRMLRGSGRWLIAGPASIDRVARWSLDHSPSSWSSTHPGRRLGLQHDEQLAVLCSSRCCIDRGRCRSAFGLDHCGQRVPHCLRLPAATFSLSRRLAPPLRRTT